MSRMTRTGIRLQVVSQECDDLTYPREIARDLPLNFWHPCMGPPEEENVDDAEDTKDAPGWLSRAGATVVATCFVAIVVAVTVRIVAWILEGI